jgi:hypothetical protein
MHVPFSQQELWKMESQQQQQQQQQQRRVPLVVGIGREVQQQEVQQLVVEVMRLVVVQQQGFRLGVMRGGLVCQRQLGWMCWLALLHLATWCTRGWPEPSQKHAEHCCGIWVTGVWFTGSMVFMLRHDGDMTMVFWHSTQSSG